MRTLYAVNNQVNNPEDRRYIPIESNTWEEWPPGPVVDAQAAILMEASTGAVLYAKNIHEQLYPASITKIMTTLLALENCEMNEVVTFSHNSVYDIEPDSSKISGVEEGDTLTMEQCLYGIMVCSGAEASYAVAEHVAGTMPEFAELMNNRAKELGCENTNFKNPHGLADDEHVTTAYDMALISREALKNPQFRIIANTLRYEFPPVPRTGEERKAVNGHKMFAKHPNKNKMPYEGFIGGKTGYIKKSGNTLVSFAKRGSMTLICVVLNESTPSHYIDTAELFDYGFEKFQLLNIEENERRFRFNHQKYFKTSTSFLEDANKALRLKPEGNVVIPNSIDFEALEKSVMFLENPEQPGAAANITYTFHGIKAGEADLELEQKDTKELQELKMRLEEIALNKENMKNKESFVSTGFLILISSTALWICIVSLIVFYIRKKSK